MVMSRGHATASVPRPCGSSLVRDWRRAIRRMRARECCGDNARTDTHKKAQRCFEAGNAGRARDQSSLIFFMRRRCGAWSVATQSTAPSARPASRASRSSCERKGGFILLIGVVLPTSSSRSVKWCGVISQVTRRWSRLALRTARSAAAVERWGDVVTALVSRKADVALDDRTFSFTGHPRKPRRKARRASVHGGAFRHAAIFRVLDHRQIKCAAAASV